MTIVEIFLIAIALSMDAFAVAVCKGLSMRKINYTRAFIISLFFGGFQGIMPLIGWFLGSRFQEQINGIDHWVIFILLSLIGIKMIYESLQTNCNISKEEVFSIKEILLLAISTSIDALAVGIAFAMFSMNEIIFSAVLIAVVTFSLSLLGVIIGNKCGSKYEKKAEFIGGFILICIGFKALFEHLNTL